MQGLRCSVARKVFDVGYIGHIDFLSIMNFEAQIHQFFAEPSKNVSMWGGTSITTLRPYAAWPRATRWVRYRQTVGMNYRPVWGVWRCSAADLELITRNVDDRYFERYENFNVWSWLAEANSNVDRVSVLPDDLPDLNYAIAQKFLHPGLRPFCIACGRNFLNVELLPENCDEGKDAVIRCVRCPHGHLLVDGEA